MSHEIATVEFSLTIPFQRTRSRTYTSLAYPLIYPPAPLSLPVVSSDPLLPPVLICRSNGPPDQTTALVPILPLYILHFLSITVKLASLPLYRPSFLSESPPRVADLILKNRQDRLFLTHPDPPLMAREFDQSSALLFPSELLD